MGLSSKLLSKFKELSFEERKKLRKMAWEDRVSFQDIAKKFPFSPSEVETFMRFELSEKDYKRWKVRQSKRFTHKSKKWSLKKVLP